MYELASNGGYIESSYKLRLIYESGKGVAHDHQLAINYYQIASDIGHSKASNSLAIYYDDGNSHQTKSIELYTKAFDGDNKFAAYN